MRRLRLIGYCATAVALAAGAPSSLAMNKCTAADGSVSFQNLPCPNATKAEVITPRVTVTTMQSGRRDLDAPQLSPLDLTGTADQRYARAHAVFEAMDTDGQECVINLKVYGLKGETLKSCGRFNAQIQQWHGPAVDQMKDLGRDDSFLLRNQHEVDRTIRLMKRVNQHVETSLARLRSLQAD
jgi:hypothetical protein